ncbi:MAG: hypothetical protein P8H97_03970 [Pseudomonadales bacterium]|nr:hypothetical protein [Pseudomonadales bacterium]MDG2080080.1 hypothetical protein [Pseudomonadales bacterium]
MKSFTNIKRYLSTTAAVLTISTASVAVQAYSGEYQFDGTVVTNPTAGGAFTVDIGGTVRALFEADAALTGGLTLIEHTPDPGDFNETLGFCDTPCTPGGAADAPNRTPTRYVVRNLDNSLVLPALRQGTSTASTLTVDTFGNITGGSVTLNVAAVPTNAVLDLTLDADTNTWELYGGGGIILLATGTGGFLPVGGENVPVMPPVMMVVAGLGLLLVGRRRLKSYVKS